MLTKKIHKCPNCGEEFTFERLSTSIIEFGFINLFSEYKEIFAANCPKQECSALWGYELEPGQSDVWHQELNAILDPSGYEKINNRFEYYSSMPFSFQAHGIWKTFGTIQIDSSDIENFEFDSDHGDKFDQGFYSFCPKSQLFNAFNKKYTVWFYPNQNSTSILRIENNTKIQLLPRFFVNDRLLKMVDEFCTKNAIKYENLKYQEVSQIPSLPYSVTGLKPRNLPRKIPKKADLSLFMVSSGRKIDDTAFDLYQILSYKIIDDRIFFDTKNNQEVIELQINHDIMMEQTSTHFNEGSLNNILFRMSSVFIQDYVQYFKNIPFSYRSLWIFKEKFLLTLYEACLSEKIFQKKGKPRSDRIVKYMVQAAAEEYWSWDPKITKEEMIKKEEIVEIREIGTWTDKTLIDWLNNLKPKS